MKGEINISDDLKNKQDDILAKRKDECSELYIEVLDILMKKNIDPLVAIASLGSLISTIIATIELDDPGAAEEIKEATVEAIRGFKVAK